jgi:hypothetical protein
MTAPPLKPAAPVSRPPSGRPPVLIAAAAILLLCLLVVLTVRFSRLLGGSAPGGGSAAVPGVAAPSKSQVRTVGPQVDSHIFQVTEATGRVETQRSGKWILVVSGDVLTQDDLVRTGIGRAILRRGSTEIELRDRVEIRLDSISQAGASVDLRRGRVVAHVGRSGDNVAITSARTRTANEGDSPARFVVTTDDHGRVAVATTEGSARFESAGRSVVVQAGNTTRAESGRPPSDPEKISEEIFLSVVWPIGDRREDKVSLTGRTDPGGLVRVNGVAAEVDHAGHFVASVPVHVGANAVDVEVEDMAGRTKHESQEIRKIPTRPPLLTPVPTELWKK